MKTSREQFEEWVRNRANDLDYKHIEYLLKTFDNGVYAVTWVDMAWEGWQASRQCIEVGNRDIVTITCEHGGEVLLRDITKIEIVEYKGA